MYRKTLILWLCVFTTNRFVLILSLFLILVFDSVLFSIMITSHGEERAGLCESRALVGDAFVCLFCMYYLLDQLMRLWYLSHRRPSKAQASLRSLARAFAVRSHELWK